ncbi:class 1b ribonucleoside-diphosphate reductase subunit beta [Paenibacillus sp. SC116]|uniref:class 1b ribonucleoside-diphosphate reductase subunit beta n=1 Tax=Paenibacillus sp. SC116 TaxID=2968986 RepID=UPI00215AC329|nr:class 1b ribonucleoside-diphosphate reductase subunit beta [Paenibacillus sp. SC116]MCR8843114.1 class 1b ribonucleoside-diphosphate reductase subunit beta [Paenibacillus sp. SC116]
MRDINFQCVNWNQSEDYVNHFWRQNVAQMWTETEFPVSKDIASWNEMTPDEQTTFKRVLAGLTGLDTHQANDGMPVILVHTDDTRKKAVLGFMAMMEQIHAKSYSHIFTTLLPSDETRYLLEEWAPNNQFLRVKGDIIVSRYRKLLTENPSKYDVYMAQVMSVFLESFLFYSGFYYPLYLAGQGRMTTSGEIIRKILLDESIHGVYVGYLAQELREELSIIEQAQADAEMFVLLEQLYANETEYTQELYGALGLAEDVDNYVRYNANKALMTLGFEPYFEHRPFNPIVLNALDTTTKTHDFFSQKGDGYVLALNVEDMRDEDFDFSGV